VFSHPRRRTVEIGRVALVFADDIAIEPSHAEAGVTAGDEGAHIGFGGGISETLSVLPDTAEAAKREFRRAHCEAALEPGFEPRDLLLIGRTGSHLLAAARDIAPQAPLA